jgi:hypothetical protein
MTDKEFLEMIETKVHFVMLTGCEMDDHLGRTKYDTASWALSFRADDMCRLIDMAKAGVKQ